ncbi:MAG: NADH-quinone oxidoreductase subunit B family protein [Candidatus Asgardarchaeia archaeon]|nr:NADH-quinone oxidoreductase subunit B family protein [Candidatus Odinarchaeota archaeon]RLG89912.1 MAG: hydrogenase [Thermoprotei archaeon]
MSRIASYLLKRSIWVYHLNTGSCNGCDIETVAVFTPRFDVERFGIRLVGTPRHADVILVTGPVTAQTIDKLKRIYEQAPEPKLVIAVGTCACTCGMFKGSYSIVGPVNKVIPVDYYIMGCPPRAHTILKGIIEALSLFKKKVMKGGKS